MYTIHKISTPLQKWYLEVINTANSNSNRFNNKTSLLPSSNRNNFFVDAGNLLNIKFKEVIFDNESEQLTTAARSLFLLNFKHALS